MKRRFYADPFKCAMLTTTALAFVLFAAALFYTASLFSAIVCLLFACVYGYGAAVNGIRLEFTADGIQRHFLCLPPNLIPWKEIREVGICGARLWRGPGTLYLYLSPSQMTEEERFQMVLRWSPKELRLRYHPPCLDALSPFWEGKIELYNTGKFTL